MYEDVFHGLISMSLSGSTMLASLASSMFEVILRRGVGWAYI